jgi:hypothetical protein
MKNKTPTVKTIPKSNSIRKFYFFLECLSTPLSFLAISPRDAQKQDEIKRFRTVTTNSGLIG